MTVKNKKYKILAGILAVLLCMFLGCKKEETIYLTDVGKQAENRQQDSTAGKSEKETETVNAENTKAVIKEEEQEPVSDSEEPKIFVHICGAVNNPGVYEFTKEERIYHAVKKAGGFTKEADETYVNQAQKVTDGIQIYIPTVGEVQKCSEDFEKKQIGITGDAIKETDGKKLVNINTATEEELCTLSGIGEGKARNIVEYRMKKGNYRSIEEIMNVEGIKQGLFDKIKDSITVS